jgi:hypothetical protein
MFLPLFPQGSLIEQHRRIPDGHSNRYRHQKRAVKLESGAYVKSSDDSPFPTQVVSFHRS